MSSLGLDHAKDQSAAGINRDDLALEVFDLFDFAAANPEVT
jgi:hypothetical protein